MSELGMFGSGTELIYPTFLRRLVVICGTFLFLWLLLFNQGWASDSASLRIHFHETQESVPREKQALFDIFKVEGLFGIEPLYVAKEPAVILTDIKEIWFKQDLADHVSLHIRFGTTGEQAMRALSESHLNKRLAIFVNDEFLMAPHMMEVLEGPEFALSLSTLQAAKTFADRLGIPFDPVQPTPEERYQYEQFLLQSGESESSK